MLRAVGFEFASLYVLGTPIPTVLAASYCPTVAGICTYGFAQILNPTQAPI